MKGISDLILNKIKTKNGESLRDRIILMGLKNTVQYWFFQRILRINSNAPWPVHPSSVVIHPSNIKHKNGKSPIIPYPGYMPGTYIQARNGIIMGRNIRFGPGVKLISANHDLEDFNKHIAEDPVEIGDNCWLGADSVILPGVKLSSHIVVGAGSVVNKSFKEKDIAIAGVPAQKIKNIKPYIGIMDRLGD